MPGIGDWTNVMELTMVASYPSDENYIAVDNFRALDTQLKLLLTELICDSKPIVVNIWKEITFGDSSGNP